MKTLLSLIMAVVFVTALQAQDNKQEKKVDTKTTTATTQTHECYQMKDGALNHCYGDRSEPVKADVKLKNGTKLTSKGEMTNSDGMKTQLNDGECVTLMGSVGDCAKMHAKGNDSMHENVK